MFLKCVRWFDTNEDEKKGTARWRGASIKVDKDASDAQIFFNISFLGSKPADLYSLRVMRLPAQWEEM